ncbi:MAG: NAD-dependent epimerase/dehydratase family protein, partial [Pedobacter sp.]
MIDEVKDQKTSDVIITGATGFVGKNLLPYLNSYDIKVNNIDRKDFVNQKWDFSKTNAIIHLAGKAHDLKKTSNPTEYYEVNFELTKKLYNAFLESDSKKFIFI